VRAFDRRQRAGGEVPPLRRQQLGKHRFTRKGVAEGEVVPVDLDDLSLNREPQRVDDGAPVDLGQAGQQVPVEPATQEGRGTKHVT
jgi:hypothetical protein